MAGKFIDFGDLDPAISATIRGGERRQASARLPKDQRKKVVREKKKSEARNGKRAVYDLDPEIIQAIKDLADDNHTTASSIATIALSLFLSSQVDIEPYLKIIDNPKYEYTADPAALPVKRLKSSEGGTTGNKRRKCGGTV